MLSALSALLMFATLAHGIFGPARQHVRIAKSWRPMMVGVGVAQNFLASPGSTVREALAFAESTLVSCGDPEASVAARHLVACAVGETGARSLSNLQSRLQDADDILSAAATEHLGELLRRRSAREPIQYLIGEWDFHMLTLKVRPPILVPRPETEELVEYILAELRAEGRRLGLGLGTTTPLRILDIGAGSGAIGLALAAALPGATCVGIDQSAEAVALARENAAMLGLQDRYECVHASLLEFVGEAQGARTFDLVVSNPPYIPRSDMAGLEPEVLVYEDDAALCGGSDGLDVVRQILDAAPGLLGRDAGGPPSGEEVGGGSIARGAAWRLESPVWLEVDSSHPPLVAELVGPGARSADTNVGAARLKLVRSIRDLGGLPRFCVLGLG